MVEYGKSPGLSYGAGDSKRSLRALRCTGHSDEPRKKSLISMVQKSFPQASFAVPRPIG